MGALDTLIAGQAHGIMRRLQTESELRARLDTIADTIADRIADRIIERLEARNREIHDEQA